jgi:hypothetical protein
MLRYQQARVVVLLILGAITVQYTISLNILGAGGGRSTTVRHRSQSASVGHVARDSVSAITFTSYLVYTQF